MLNNSGESGHPCLAPDLRGNALFFTIENNVCCGFIIYGLYYVEVDFFYAQFLKSCYHKGVLKVIFKVFFFPFWSVFCVLYSSFLYHSLRFTGFSFFCPQIKQ